VKAVTTTSIEVAILVVDAGGHLNEMCDGSPIARSVVRDDEEARASCPHGGPWFVVIRIVHEERSAHA
jgi:hypothetical protein